MSGFIAKYIAKKILGEKMENNFGKEDPYFESVPATRIDGKQSKKMKKMPKALPPGISEHDGKVLTKVKRRAYRLDSGWSLLGMRVGWSSVIGIIPFVGDALDAFMALMVIRTCQQVEGGIPKSLNGQMMFNLALDFAVGLVPFIGDLADMLFRCNTKNAILLEDFLRKKGAKAMKAQGRTAQRDSTLPEEFDRMMNEQTESPPSYINEPSSQRQTGGTTYNSHAQEARVAQPKKSWFGGQGRVADVEQGHARQEIRNDGRSGRR
ncbi:PH-containing protein [Glarea lozoyensis ATCC 20868]|uniref:PH-containing protein n=2 Tax=Glarea lozoyensis TaxID=101852 RepID=S3E5T0_GLAL2|nr:PH-containing protein [Glarea lozoyensis ATCC 20868]EHK99508.1 putative Uncharacterized membrane protein [Glarea lozoyensis 74030]EPE33728.1 PH-containing protein [Glarea lozoyensis ATCC 20868]